ncbi:hypothetical protein BOTBODRAFT_108786, partial [Botryobasidium botryosum FD-172 SS1]
MAEKGFSELKLDLVETKEAAISADHQSELTLISYNQTKFKQILSHVGVLSQLAAIATWNSHHVCLENTRASVLDDVTRWVHDVPEHGPNAPFFLSGRAGTGKSSVANSLAAQYDSLGSLGSAFFFDRAVAGRNSPGGLFKSVARELAARNPIIREAVVAALKRDPGLLDADFSRQFASLVRDPCYKAATGSPIVMI